MQPLSSSCSIFCNYAGRKEIQRLKKFIITIKRNRAAHEKIGLTAIQKNITWIIKVRKNRKKRNMFNLYVQFISY